MRFVQFLRHLSNHSVALAFFAGFLILVCLCAISLYQLLIIQTPKTVRIKLAVPYESALYVQETDYPIKSELTVQHWKEQYAKHEHVGFPMISYAGNAWDGTEKVSATYWLKHADKTYYFAREEFANPFKPFSASTDSFGVQWQSFASIEYTDGNYLVLTPISNRSAIAFGLIIFICLFSSGLLLSFSSLCHSKSNCPNNPKLQSTSQEKEPQVTESPIDETLSVDDSEPGHLPHV